MKINKVLFIISTICIFAFIGCEEQVLDKKPKDLFSDKDVYSDINLIELLVDHTYNSTASWGINIQQWWGRRMGIENACDECYHHWNPSIYKIDIGIITPDDMGMFKNLWEQKYDFIREANVFFSKIDKSEAKIQNPEKVEELKGEMKYLRASLYFDLINYFGGVPITDKPFELTDESFNIPRNSYEDCVNF
ncbi:MAG: RagB/SusD family nutrient uptake outer membrane protein, partial [Promethearchaeota archaeon]